MACRCDKPGFAGSIVKVFGEEKLLSVESTIGCAVGTQKIRMSREKGRQWRPSLSSVRRKQRLCWESLCGIFDLRISVLVSWGWRIICDWEETGALNEISFLGKWCWWAGAENPAINNRSASLRGNLLGSISTRLAYRSYQAGVGVGWGGICNKAGSWTW